MTKSICNFRQFIFAAQLFFCVAHAYAGIDQVANAPYRQDTTFQEQLIWFSPIKGADAARGLPYPIEFLNSTRASFLINPIAESVPVSLRGENRFLAQPSIFRSNQNQHRSLLPAAAPQLPVLVDDKRRARYLEIPIHFERSAEHHETAPDIQARGVGYQLSLRNNEVVVRLNGKHAGSGTPKAGVLRLGFPGANPDVRPTVERELSGKANYLFGKDSSKWRTDVPLFEKVRYQNVYAGIDRVFYGNQGQLEYDWIVAPGADPKQIRESIEGADNLAIDPSGDLLIEMGDAIVRHRKPVAYQEIDGKRITVAAEYILADNREIHFKVGAYDASQRLVIDPVLSYATFIGADVSAGGAPAGVAVDTNGNVYIAGDRKSVV